MLRTTLLLLLGLPLAAQQPDEPGTRTVRVDRTHYDPACGVSFDLRHDHVRLEWPAGEGRRCAASLTIIPTTPLLRTLEAASGDAGFAKVAMDLDPAFTVTVGTAKMPPAERARFFDKPADRAHEAIPAVLDIRTVRVTSEGKRLVLAYGPFEAGAWKGELVVRIYAGSPLLHLEAVLTPDRDGLAYIYDAVLTGDLPAVAWTGLDDKLHREAPPAQVRPLAVRFRTILAEFDEGSVAVSPPPHAFFFPRDRTDNFKFAQAGKGRFGLRQDPAGGGAFVPWFDAPKGKAQRMGMFVLVSGGKAEAALADVQRYTRGDTFKKVEGRATFTSHWHARLAVNELAGTPTAPEFVAAFRRLGVDIVHLAEFHGDGHRDDRGATRLAELKAMFDVCRRHSGDGFLLLPGEEGNRWLGKPAKEKEHPGHWMCLFPKPVYFTWGPGEPDLPFSEEVPECGTVYHVESTEDMVELLRREKGLAWAAHPRIKASYATPDAFRDEPWFRSEIWLGAAWKAMPADLSEPRLGRRALDCLDDLWGWGTRQKLLGEVDCFEVDRSHELYGPMNVNYLKLDRVPTFDDWSPVLDALRQGEFFVTTGEILIHKCDARKDRVTADVEWTFPPEAALVVWGDATGAHFQEFRLADKTECGRETLGLPVDLSRAAWARLEVRDVAGNLAFTQPRELK